MGNVQSHEGEIVVVWAIQILLILASSAQDDPSVNVRPMVFPEPMNHAATVIDSWISEAFNFSDHAMFLSYDYWPCPLNNSTIA